MRAQLPAPGDSRAFAVQALLWLDLAALAVGALHFTFVPESLIHPLLAAIALLFLAVSTLLARALPLLSRPSTRQHRVDIFALVVSVTLLAAATGGAASTLLVLYAFPLAGVALAFNRWWAVLLLAFALGIVVLALAAFADAARDAALLAHIVTVLAPATAVALILAALVDRMQTAVLRISALASTDALTGLLNLHAFEDVLQQEHRKAERFGRNYTVVVIDVENLSQVNEMLGHEAGSQVLKTVAAAITRSIRSSDVAARLGGDEFVVLLVEADSATGAAIGQRIRNNVYAGTVSVGNRLIRASVNVGSASFPEDHLYPKELMVLADQRMQKDRELRRPPAA